jgi:hypothetical protein
MKTEQEIKEYMRNLIKEQKDLRSEYWNNEDDDRLAEYCKNQNNIIIKIYETLEWVLS